ncbi:putative cAMP-dependent protein kinase type 1 [Paratrimastix pyriformis]|uniref:cAMP-dependent protein kinase type 1 n=1 Tax=Paratrimastix pyriformis TaxID=342808 RepID=A0ABQ8UQW3_9EUKA|nr:putative cAMP-dependent protein kinase type 1 [Paratrimastix pyriformis]
MKQDERITSDFSALRLSRAPQSKTVLTPLASATAGAVASVSPPAPSGSLLNTSTSAHSSPAHSTTPKSQNRSSSAKFTPLALPPPLPELNPMHGEFKFDKKPTPNDFEMLQVLGTGTFGKVRLVRHKASGKFFAMKILRKTTVCQLRQAQHIRNERRLLLQYANHPRIVHLYGTMQDAEHLYMIQEYVAGGEIFSHLRKKGNFQVPTARYYAAQIVLVLEHLHANNVVYRDLKPENLLLDANGQLKITDFGFAKEVPDVTFTLCGTPEYLAPEIILNSGHSKAVDWWALGILIYEMIFGFPPFFDDNPFRTYEKIVQLRLPFPRTIDPAAKDLIKKLLKKDKTERLGCLHGGTADVKNHPFFRGVNWEALLLGTTRAPISPVVRSESDTHNFEEYAEEDDGPDQEMVANMSSEPGPDSDPSCFADF